jgi:FkbM family methyltransferase
VHKLFKQPAKHLLQKLGIEVRRVSRVGGSVRGGKRFGSSGTESLSFVEGAVTALMSEVVGSGRKWTIMQVGANDGITDDPVNGFAMRHRDETALTLIEPQKDISEKLSSTYREHSEVNIANIAIGPGSQLSLFRIRPDLAQYYRGIIASGITSSNRAYVEQKALKLLPKKIRDREESEGRPLISQIDVPCMNLVEAWRLHGHGGFVDWLQIDVEGFDDKVIMEGGIEKIKPLIINYEISHLGNERHSDLAAFLDAAGYRRTRWSRSDECAIYTQTNR